MSKLKAISVILLAVFFTLLTGVGCYDTIYNPHTQLETIENTITVIVVLIAIIVLWVWVWKNCLKEVT